MPCIFVSCGWSPSRCNFSRRTLAILEKGFNAKHNAYINIYSSTIHTLQERIFGCATMESLTYETAVKKAQLVERQPDQLLNPLRVSMHEEEDIIALATQIQNADKQLKSSTSQKLCLILEQIKMLQSQAMKILKESDENRIIHSAACNFIKKPGHVYHLYQRSSGQNYFSMVSPEEWNGSVDHKFLGSYRLEYDMSWTPLDKIAEHDAKIKWAEKCIDKATLKTAPMAIDFNLAD